MGPSSLDDAAVMRWPVTSATSSGPLLVQTVDFITPVVDDPFIFGAVAAANSLSDIYAMGGEPRFALNLLQFPRKVDGEPVPLDVLREILRGGSDKAHQAGVSIVGGHSIVSPEPTYGLAVTGEVRQEQLVTNAGGKPGDALILTKAIGTGLLIGALKKGQLSEGSERALVASMTMLNQTAGSAMVQARAHAATDVTGFGLLGHASHMAKASGLRVQIEADAVPLLPDARTLAADASMGGAAGRNWAYVEGSVSGSTHHVSQRLFADPQTSGGLLIAVAESRCRELVQRLHDGDCEAATVIGRLAEGQPSVQIS